MDLPAYRPYPFPLHHVCLEWEGKEVMRLVCEFKVSSLTCSLIAPSHSRAMEGKIVTVLFTHLSQMFQCPKLGPLTTLPA